MQRLFHSHLTLVMLILSTLRNVAPIVGVAVRLFHSILVVVSCLLSCLGLFAGGSRPSCYGFANAGRRAFAACCLAHSAARGVVKFSHCRYILATDTPGDGVSSAPGACKHRWRVVYCREYQNSLSRPVARLSVPRGTRISSRTSPVDQVVTQLTQTGT